jgi:hypothetical protein
MLLELDLQDNFLTEKSAANLLHVLDPTKKQEKQSGSVIEGTNQFLKSIDLRQNEFKSNSLV